MKNKRLKVQNRDNEDVQLIKKLIIILVVVVLVIIGFYFLTDKVVKPTKNENKTSVDIDYNIATVGTMFNRPYQEYFVILYDSTKSEATYYDTLVSNYRNNSEKSTKLYYVDLSLKTNSAYVSDTANKSMTGVDDAKFSGATLLKISNGKVVSFIDDREIIKSTLN